MTIEEAIKQKRFINEYQRAHLNVLYTAAAFTYETTQALKPFEITWQQFNVLRILRGQNPEPCTVKLLTERMLDKMSNASRLVDKLVKKKLVSRQASKEDRRRVDVFITEEGLALVDEASTVIDQMLDAHSSGITETEANELNRLLDCMRESFTQSEDKS